MFLVHNIIQYNIQNLNTIIMPQAVSLKLSNLVIQVLQLQVPKRDDVEHANVHLKAFLCVLETIMTSSFLLT